MKKKALALLAALVLVIGCIIGGTLAWLTDKTGAVVNTFSTSDINIKLEETTGTDYKMVPGYTIAKDPQVTVLAGSEKCYLFVKLEKSQNFDTFLTYKMAEGWTLVPGETNVYYRKVQTADIGTAYSVLEGDQVTVRGEVTKAMMDGLTTEALPKLTVTAYASQLHKNATTEFTAAEAWENVNPTNP